MRYISDGAKTTYSYSTSKKTIKSFDRPFYYFILNNIGACIDIDFPTLVKISDSRITAKTKNSARIIFFSVIAGLASIVSRYISIYYEQYIDRRINEFLLFVKITIYTNYYFVSKYENKTLYRVMSVLIISAIISLSYIYNFLDRDFAIFQHELRYIFLCILSNVFYLINLYYSEFLIKEEKMSPFTINTIMKAVELILALQIISHTTLHSKYLPFRESLFESLLMNIRNLKLCITSIIYIILASLKSTVDTFILFIFTGYSLLIMENYVIIVEKFFLFICGVSDDDTLRPKQIYHFIFLFMSMLIFYLTYYFPNLLQFNMVGYLDLSERKYMYLPDIYSQV